MGKVKVSALNGKKYQNTSVIHDFEGTFINRAFEEVKEIGERAMEHGDSHAIYMMAGMTEILNVLEEIKDPQDLISITNQIKKDYGIQKELIYQEEKIMKKMNGFIKVQPKNELFDKLKQGSITKEEFAIQAKNVKDSWDIKTDKNGKTFYTASLKVGYKDGEEFKESKPIHVSTYSEKEVALLNAMSLNNIPSQVAFEEVSLDNGTTVNSFVMSSENRSLDAQLASLNIQETKSNLVPEKGVDLEKKPRAEIEM